MTVSDQADANHGGQAPANTATSLSRAELDVMAETLRASGLYRVLRRLEPRRVIHQADGTTTRSGLFVDVETTGLDPEKDEIIELAMVPFTYAIDGRIFTVEEAFERFNQPSKPIPEEVTRLTGITNEMVAGHRIDVSEVAVCVDKADLVIAHNAAFDRRFLERLCDLFARKPWACSMAEINWVEEGHEGTKLGYLAAGVGFFYDRHRAVNDCHAAIEMLSLPLPKSGELAMTRLLANARQPGWRIWARGAPYDFKDTLKARGYRWNGNDSRRPRAWFIDVEDQQRDAEIAYLQREIYRRTVELPMDKLSAYNRFSDRAS